MAHLNVEAIARHAPTRIEDQPSAAAVVVPILNRADDHGLLFTKRAQHLGEHPGQMSFPGGGVEPEDGSLRETALREADEEIGLERTEATVVGQLDDIRTITEYAVTPFVARVPDRSFEPDHEEVAEIAVLSLSDLLDRDNYEYEMRDHPYYGEIVIHYFHVDDYTVWGATARILVQFLELVTDFQPPVRLDRSEY